MKIVFPALLWLGLTGYTAVAQRTTALIPQPQTVISGTGQFVITARTRLNVLTPVANIRQMVADYLPGIPFNDAPKQTKTITIRLASAGGLGPEGYELNVAPTGIVLTAPEPAGIFYGLQTLRQLLPAGQVKGQAIAALTIRDQPRFGWRGLMLDVSRHFFPKTAVKRFIDQMAQYKFNVFHWHLTDDQGWRVEIKSLPRLTQVGAWRVPRMGDWNSIDNPQPGEMPTYGGFYTQDDIREVVAYAQQRHIMIVPEIDMPGHSLAAIAAYPYLTCGGKAEPVPPNGKFYTLEDNTLNPCSDSTYVFIDRVLTEIAALFPGPYIHIGGDEAYKGFWEQCAACKPVMAANGLKNVEELQSYFIRRVAKIVQTKGKKPIGWDEILEGEGPTIRLAPDATVMSWRGMKGGIEAARQGHPVIMTPAQHCYLDLYQGEPTAEPATYGLCRLSDSYAFEPLSGRSAVAVDSPGVDSPDSVGTRLILGGQGNLWTESVPTFRHAEYMLWPRSFALAEVLWSPGASRNWPDFIRRMESHLTRFDALGINYARSYLNPIVGVKKHPMGILEISLSHELPGTELFYTIDNTVPDRMTTRYTQPFILPKGANRIKVVAFRAGTSIGRLIDVPLADLEKRAK